MPTIVLSPSSQWANQYAGGPDGREDSEARHVRDLADLLTPQLRAAGFTVHDLRDDSLARRVERSNVIRPDLHLALHSNASNGSVRGSGMFVAYRGGLADQYATILDRHVSAVTPTGDLGVKAYPHYETTRTVSPAVIAELDFHDNPGGAEWLRTHKPELAAALLAALVEAFHLPASPAPVPKPVPPAPEPVPVVTVDGLWGPATTRALQARFGTPVDGVVSSQEVAWRSRLAAAVSGWEWVRTPRGSQLIAAMQTWLGITADGIAGVDYINALIRRMGLRPDGRLDRPSPTVAELQRRLNAGTL